MTAAGSPLAQRSTERMRSVQLNSRGKTVVITGASSGLGRAAAIEFARRGARVVASGRRLEALEETTQLCRKAGTEAWPFVADVTSEAQVLALCRHAIEVGGSVDVWVNNAGVTSFGSVEETPVEDLRRVVEVNLWGAVHGARAILPHFSERGRGVLINVGSVLSRVGQPFVPAYVISKFALRGLSEALRAEVARQPGIFVCTLLPYAMSTQHFQAGANLIGREPHAMPPCQPPDRVARELVDLAESPRREVLVPRSAALGLALHALFPRAVERVIYDSLSRFHFGAARPLDDRGNLWEPPTEPARVHGTRVPLLSFPELLGWIVGHYGARGLRALAGL